MPARFLTLIIIVCWLGACVWLFLTDIWPRIRPGEPPAYTIMPSDEVMRRSDGPPVFEGPPLRWNVYHNGIHTYYLEAWTKYVDKGDDPSQDHTFEMWAIFRSKQQPAPVRRLRTLTRITREGELREVNAELHMEVQKKWECRFDIGGRIVQGELLPRWRVRTWPADEDTPDRVFDRPREYKHAPI